MAPPGFSTDHNTDKVVLGNGKYRRACYADARRPAFAAGVSAALRPT